MLHHEHRNAASVSHKLFTLTVRKHPLLLQRTWLFRVVDAIVISWLYLIFALRNFKSRAVTLAGY